MAHFRPPVTTDDLFGERNIRLARKRGKQDRTLPRPATFKLHPFSVQQSQLYAPSPFRQQRAVIKAHFFRASTRRAHTQYIQREGTGIDGKKAELFSNDPKNISTQELPGEQRHFRMILSAERGRDLNIPEYTKDFMAEFQRIYREHTERCPDDQKYRATAQNAKLIWYAAAHYNTDNPHSHIVIRGLDSHGNEVRFDKEDLRLAREAAQQLATHKLGLRTDQQIEAQLQSEITSYRLTRIDRQIESQIDKRGYTSPLNETQKQRLDFLTQNLQLADKIASPARRRDGSIDPDNSLHLYYMKPHWSRTLEYNGRKDDVIKTIFNDLTPKLRREVKSLVGERQLYVYKNDWSVRGSVLTSGIADELTDRPFVVVQSEKALYFFSSKTLKLSDLTPGKEIKIDHGSVSLGTQTQKLSPEKTQHIPHSTPHKDLSDGPSIGR